MDLAQKEITERYCFGPGLFADEWPPPWSKEEKIKIFQIRIQKWNLDFAREFALRDHAGFAALSIILSYFEMDRLYELGITEDIEKDGPLPENPGDTFKAGIDSIARSMKWRCSPRTEFDNFKEIMFEAVRCGIYHSGMVRRKVVITGDIEEVYNFRNGLLRVHPRLLIESACAHFERYINKLLKDCTDDPGSMRLHNFEQRFDAEVTTKVETWIRRTKGNINKS